VSVREYVRVSVCECVCVCVYVCYNFVVVHADRVETLIMYVYIVQ